MRKSLTGNVTVIDRTTSTRHLLPVSCAQLNYDPWVQLACRLSVRVVKTNTDTVAVDAIVQVRQPGWLNTTAVFCTNTCGFL